jgi:hypothetical protein
VCVCRLSSFEISPLHLGDVALAMLSSIDGRSEDDEVLILAVQHRNGAEVIVAISLCDETGTVVIVLACRLKFGRILQIEPIFALCSKDSTIRIYLGISGCMVQMCVLVSVSVRGSCFTHICVC